MYLFNKPVGIRVRVRATRALIDALKPWLVLAPTRAPRSGTITSHHSPRTPSHPGLRPTHPHRSHAGTPCLIPTTAGTDTSTHVPKHPSTPPNPTATTRLPMPYRSPYSTQKPTAKQQQQKQYTLRT
jgi:hypothetical protein